MRIKGLFATAFSALFFYSINVSAGLSLPPGDINLTVKSGTVSFFDIALSGVPPGYHVANKTYAAWCVDRFNDFDPSLDGGQHTGYLLDIYSGSLPANYADVPWDKVLYLLNHKRGTIDDVQHAIWYYTDGISPDPLIAPLAGELIAEADAYGVGFVPGPSQLSAAFVVWTAPNPFAQGNIIEIPGAPDVGGEVCSDRFTAGGFIYRDGSKVTFGIQGGVKNGGLSGGINLIDHGTGMHVRGRTITSYSAIDANCRQAVYDVTIDGEAGTATVVVCDYGEPGRNDVLEIVLSNGYMAGQGSTLGADGNGGGNVQLHKGSCNEPPQAKPNSGGKKPKKPGVGNGNGNGKPPGNVGKGNGKGDGKGKGNGKNGGKGGGKGKKARNL